MPLEIVFEKRKKLKMKMREKKKKPEGSAFDNPFSMGLWHSQDNLTIL